MFHLQIVSKNLTKKHIFHSNLFSKTHPIRQCVSSIISQQRIRTFGSSSSHPDQSSSPTNPRRALMYIPGNDDRKLSKIPKLNADCICLDCEDGVAWNQKETARHNIYNLLNQNHQTNHPNHNSVDALFGDSECTVRVNSVESGLCVEDVTTILSANRVPDSIHLPKCRGKHDLEILASSMTHTLSKQEQQQQQPLGLIMFIESARALLDIDTICNDAWTLSNNGAPFIPQAIVFGSDDYIADIGATRTKQATEVCMARQTIITAANAHNLQAIDCVYVDYHDMEGLKRQSQEGARWGFTGKQVIHPSQVDVVRDAFSPSVDRVRWAMELLEEYRVHQGEGRGAFTFRGTMVDMPLVKKAQNVIEIRNRMQQREREQ